MVALAVLRPVSAFGMRVEVSEVLCDGSPELRLVFLIFRVSWDSGSWPLSSSVNWIRSLVNSLTAV